MQKHLNKTEPDVVAFPGLQEQVSGTVIPCLGWASCGQTLGTTAQIWWLSVMAEMW